MLKYFKFLSYVLLALFMLAGCSHKINPQSINTNILLKDAISIPDFMASKTYSTYDSQSEKITMYHFKKIDGALQVSEVISYIPFDFYHELYREFTDVPMTLRSLTHGQESTLESALEAEAARNHYTRLFKDKDEFIIGNNFAFEIQTAIRRYKERMQRYEREDDRDRIRQL
ncbi:hypothetical protein [Sulfurospirillum sp. 1612]|uniref:hypothetical protein n=1 Tax=Sulfurospirillum sp. 1612 TaxID=3094835 RepID=UPI002F937227